MSHLGCAKLFRASSVRIKLGSPQPSFTKSLESCTSTRSLLEVSILRDSKKELKRNIPSSEWDSIPRSLVFNA